MSKRGENIHQRKDGRWEARILLVNEYGSTKYKSVYGKSYKEVKEKKLQIIIKNDVFQEKRKKQLFEDVADEWMLNSFFKQKQSTKLKYQYILESHIKPEFGKCDISKIDENAINNFLVKKLTSGKINDTGGLSCSYVKTMGIIIGSIINYAVSKGYRLPLKTKINKPSCNKKEITVMSTELQKQLEERLKYDNSLTALGIKIAMNTGLRIGEICALKWEDIDLQNSVIHVRHTVARIKAAEDSTNDKTCLIIDKPKTESSIRDIPIISKILNELIKAKSLAVSDFVVSDKSNFVSPRTFEYRFHKILKMYGIPDTNFHCLRHSFATRCVELNIDVKTLSEILGHANVGITLNTYVHPSFEAKRSQLERLSSACSFNI